MPKDGIDNIIPPRKKPTNDKGYFEILTKAVFQAGFSWKTVEKKWSGFEEIFDGFDPVKISKWGDGNIIRALESPKIIRNPKKIEATVYNAQSFIDTVEEHGSFEKYIASIRDEDYADKTKMLSKKFKWLGKTGAFFFFLSINEEVPEWAKR